MTDKWPALAELADMVRTGKTTATELVKHSLQQAKAHHHYNALLELNESAALARAQEIDAGVKSGQTKGRLLGIPFIAKDNFLTYNTETTAASNILKGFKAPYQATAVEKLEEEGAILLAKANLDAFAHGTSTENSDFGPVKNPYDQGRVAGGSSGGPAAAIALQIAPFALGTDTGGSIRLPASFTGVVGLKPTYGLVSRYGVIAMGSSTDVIGPLTNTVGDAALVLDVMAGQDWKDSTTISRKPTYLVKEPAKKLKIGLIKEYLGKGIDPGVAASIKSAATLLEQSGSKVDTASIKAADFGLAAYYIIVPAEVSSNLARYDGIKFGYSHQAAKDLDEVYDLSRAKGFGYEAKRRILIGTYVLSSGYYDAYYKKAQQVRTLIVEDFQRAFENYDVLIGPVTPTPAFQLGEHTQNPLEMYLADIMTVGANLAGLPAISVPVQPVNDLPVGLQIIGRQGADQQVLAVAKQVEELMK